jgi:hypothetical protein
MHFQELLVCFANPPPPTPLFPTSDFSSYSICWTSLKSFYFWHLNFHSTYARLFILLTKSDFSLNRHQTFHSIYDIGLFTLPTSGFSLYLHQAFHSTYIRIFILLTAIDFLLYLRHRTLHSTYIRLFNLQYLQDFVGTSLILTLDLVCSVCWTSL